MSKHKEGCHYIDGGLCTCYETTDSIGTSAMVFNAKPQYLTIQGNSGMLVQIDMDTGAIEFGPNYTPDVAARAFWEALAARHP